MNIVLRQGDCVKRLAELPEGSVRAFITDPPYGLEFMGKEWDRLAPDPDVGQMSNAGFSDGSFKGMKVPSYGANSNVKCRTCGKWRWDHVGRKCVCAEPDLPNIKAIQGHLIEGWHTRWLAESLRALTPGGVIKAFSATRTYHRLAMAMEAVGFEIAGLEAWGYGTGFPKNLDVAKALDRLKHNTDEIYEVTAWIRQARDDAGITSQDINDAFGFVGMASHWTSSTSQPAVPTLEQVPTLLKVLKDPDIPERIQELLINLNQCKGQPAEDWFRREVVGHAKRGNSDNSVVNFLRSAAHEYDITKPFREEAKKFEGFGTALKPSWEPFVIGRKP